MHSLVQQIYNHRQGFAMHGCIHANALPLLVDKRAMSFVYMSEDVQATAIHVRGAHTLCKRLAARAFVFSREVADTVWRCVREEDLCGRRNAGAEGLSVVGSTFVLKCAWDMSGCPLQGDSRSTSCRLHACPNRYLLGNRTPPKCGPVRL